MIPSDDFENLLQNIAEKLGVNNEDHNISHTESTPEFKKFIADINAVIDPKYGKYNFIGIANDPESNRGSAFCKLSCTRETAIVLVQRIMEVFYKKLKERTPEPIADAIMMLMVRNVISDNAGTAPKSYEISETMIKLIMNVNANDDEDSEE